MRMSSLIKLDNICKSFSGKSVLENVSLEAQAGELLVIIGPNGSGKTTLLRLIDLLETPDSGRILFQGNDVLSDPAMKDVTRMKIGMVFQQATVFDTSVYNNVAWTLRMRGSEDNSLGRSVENVLELVGLLTIKSQRARTLSGGEAQRLALARVMVYQPQLLLMDEPTANLDPYNVGVIEEVILRVNRDLGTTIIMATHNMFQARRLGREIALLLDGEIIETGSPEDIFEHPVDEKTSSFVKGEMVY